MPELEQLGKDLAAVDTLIVDLIKRRMDIADLVGLHKARTKQAMYRAEIEDQRLDAIGEHAKRIGLNHHLARSILYFLIGESCKLQAIQLQSAPQPDLEILGGEARRKLLKANLLRLTQLIAKDYDAKYTVGHLATKAYVRFESGLISKNISKLENRGVALDLGCGTGSVSLMLASQFRSVKGYDLSQHMLYEADLKKEKNHVDNVSFERIDVEEDEFSLADGSVSFAVMNLGTASDVADITVVLAKIKRALEINGRFFLSFYNADALVYKCGFLPWPVSLAAVLNPYTDCLDVRVGEEVISIFARLYSEIEIRKLMPSGLEIDSVSSHPLLASILPEDFFKSLPNPEVIDEVDRRLSDAVVGSPTSLSSAGAYLTLTGRKATD